MPARRRSQMQRRDFLSPRQMVSSAGHVVGALEELRQAALESLSSDPVPSPEYSLLRYWRSAMATTFEVMLPFGTPEAGEIAEEALNEIDRLEAQLTVYRETSEVHRLNRAAAHGPVPVEEGLFRLLELAAQLNAATDGAFDISAGALVRAWGFFKGPPRVPSEEERHRALDCTGMGQVVLDPERRTVRFLRPGLELNLGSIGKGHALDCVARRLRQRGSGSALLHGGHSSVYAVGSEPGTETGWTIGLAHPWVADQRLGVVRLRNQGLGTSAATFRHLEYNGRKLGHILDPRTGWPAEGMASVSVIAPTAAEADALATAFYILGPERARLACEVRPEIGVLLLPEQTTATPILLGLARVLVRI